MASSSSNSRASGNNNPNAKKPCLNERRHVVGSTCNFCLKTFLSSKSLKLDDYPRERRANYVNRIATLRAQPPVLRPAPSLPMLSHSVGGGIRPLGYPNPTMNGSGVVRGPADTGFKPGSVQGPEPHLGPPLFGSEFPKPCYVFGQNLAGSGPVKQTDGGYYYYPQQQQPVKPPVQPFCGPSVHPFHEPSVQPPVWPPSGLKPPIQPPFQRWVKAPFQPWVKTSVMPSVQVPAQPLINPSVESSVEPLVEPPHEMNLFGDMEENQMMVVDDEGTGYDSSEASSEATESDPTIRVFITEEDHDNEMDSHEDLDLTLKL